MRANVADVKLSEASWKKAGDVARINVMEREATDGGQRGKVTSELSTVKAMVSEGYDAKQRERSQFASHAVHDFQHFRQIFSVDSAREGEMLELRSLLDDTRDNGSDVEASPGGKREMPQVRQGRDSETFRQRVVEGGRGYRG